MRSKVDSSKGKGTGRLVKVDGTEHRFHGDFKALQGAVGGLVEWVPKHGVAVDEEGRLKGYKLNKHATAKTGIQLFGDVVFITPEEFAKCK